MQFVRQSATTPARLSAGSLRLSLTLVLAVVLAVCVLGVPRASAQDDQVTIDAGGDALDLHTGRGMAADNPRVAPILAAHPDQLVVICVAGCNGKPRAVQILPIQKSGQRVSGYIPTAGKMGRETYGPPRPGKRKPRIVDTTDDVVCEAGCIGRPGRVLQRMSDLPPPAQSRGPVGPAAHEALPQVPPAKQTEPAQRTTKQAEPKANEPLDIGR